MSGLFRPNAVACVFAMSVAGMVAAQQVIEGADQTAPGNFGACCLPDGECIDTEEQSCLDQGGEFLGDGSTCDVTAPGDLCQPIVLNDQCEGTLRLEVPSSTFGTTEGAEFDDVPLCSDAPQDTVIQGVWYWVTGNGFELTASLCNGSIETDSRITVFCSCESYACVAVAQQNCPAAGGVVGLVSTEVTWCSEPGVVYRILVETLGQSSSFTLNLFDGSSCSPEVICPQGACCLPDAECVSTEEDGCLSLGGVYSGDGSSCAGFFCPPDNDDCETAIPVQVPSSTFGTTAGAEFDDVVLCPTSPENTVIQGVWYSVVGNGLSITASLCNGVLESDSRITVYCACDNLACVASAQQNCNVDGVVLGQVSTEVSWCSDLGREYRILVETLGTSDDFVLDVFSGGSCLPSGVCQAQGACCLVTGACVETSEIDCLSQGGVFLGEFTACSLDGPGGPCVPSNDDCENALPVSAPGSVPGTTIGADFDDVPICGPLEPDTIIQGVWYQVIGGDFELTASLCNGSVQSDTRITVYCSCEDFTCVASAQQNCDVDGAVLGQVSTEVTWCPEPGRAYLILVETLGIADSFILEIFEGGTCLPEPVCRDEFCGADHCEDAGAVCPGITYNVDNYTATSDYLEALPNGNIDDIFFCGPFLGLFDVWCKYTPATDGLLFVHIEGPSGVGTEWIFGIYDGCRPDSEVGGEPQLLVCNTALHHGVLVWEVQEEVTYWIRSAARNFDRGEFVLNLVGPPCENGEEAAQSLDPCTLDVTGDGVVDMDDLARVLREAMPCPDPVDCPADVTGDGTVDAKDVTTVLSRLGSVCTKG